MNPCGEVKTKEEGDEGIQVSVVHLGIAQNFRCDPLSPYLAEHPLCRLKMKELRRCRILGASWEIRWKALASLTLLPRNGSMPAKGIFNADS